MFGFSSARTMQTAFPQITSSTVYVAPYTPKLPFTTIPEKRPDSRSKPPVMLNPKAILSKLERNQGDGLVKITLGVESSMRGPTMWDAMFNLVTRDGLSACVFSAKPGYAPHDHRHTVHLSRFLDYNLSSSRIALNQIGVGDHIGIAIFDARKNTTSVFLYDVTGLCLIKDAGDKGGVTAAVNCDLQHFYNLKSDGSGEVSHFGAEDELPELGEKFVSWLRETANDVANGYAWRSHYLPANLGNIDRAAVAVEAQEMVESAEAVSYAEFEDICREAYKSLRPEAKARGEEGGKRRSNRVYPPTAMVISRGDGSYLVKINKGEQAGKAFAFSRESVEESTPLETHLLGEDLDLTRPQDLSHAVLLPQDQFGANSVIYWLSVNF